MALFEEKVNGSYLALHRPHNQGFGRPSIWLAESPDLIHWGNHHCLVRPDESVWEHYKVGAGASPIKTDQGWLIIYHGKGEGGRYSLNTVLLNTKNPRKVVAKGSVPFMVPERVYETKGFFDNVVFSNGHVVRDGVVYIYYGACDGVTCLCTVMLQDLIDHTFKTPE